MNIVSYCDLVENYNEFFEILKQNELLDFALAHFGAFTENLDYKLINFRSFWLWMFARIDSELYQIHGDKLQAIRNRICQDHNSHKGSDLYVNFDVMLGCPEYI
jgi:hypothetical protein